MISKEKLFEEIDSLQLSFPKNIITPGTLLNYARSDSAWSALLGSLDLIENDDIDDWRRRFYKLGRDRMGSNWDYVDNVVLANAFALAAKPETVLEIGVRRGFLTASIASIVKTAELVLVDPWESEYAGRPNPGPELVKKQLKNVGFTGNLRIYQGYSIDQLPRVFREDAGKTYDMIIVDGDHTVPGANADLEYVFNKVSLGGLLIFDDVAHPDFLELWDLWKTWEEKLNMEFKFGSYLDQGHGVAFAIRGRKNEQSSPKVPSGEKLRGIYRKLLGVIKR